MHVNVRSKMYSLMNLTNVYVHNTHPIEIGSPRYSQSALGFSQTVLHHSRPQDHSALLSSYIGLTVLGLRVKGVMHHILFYV